MKKILLIIIGLFTIHNVNSQIYYPFPTDSATWDCLFWHQWSPDDIYLTNSQYLLIGDTNINGVAYNKLYYRRSDNLYIGGIREDSLKNIYFFPYDEHLPTPEIIFPSDTTEYLIYTFNNLDSGMVLPINTDVYDLTVIGIDSVLLGDSYRKRYKIQHDGLGGEDYWIEGIGSINELFSSYTYIFEWNYYTLCFTDTTTYYINSPNGEDSCHYWIPVGLTENTKDEIYLYPNPASKSILIKSSLEKEMGLINIYSSTGKLIIQDKLTDCELKMNIERIKSGLYIVEIDYGNRKQYSKFVKK